MKELQQKFQLRDTIEPDQRAFFNRHGFIHFSGFLTRGQVQAAWADVERAAQKLIRAQTEAINGIPVKYGIDEQGRQIIHRLPFGNLVSREVAAIFQDKRLRLLADFVPGYDMRLGLQEKDGVVVNYFVNSADSKYKQMGWHTDVLRDFFMGKKVLPMINIGIYFDDSNAHNGGLRILPGTHKQSIFGMLFKKVQIFDTKEDKAEFLIQARAGDLVLHHGRIWHRVARSPHIGPESRRRVMYAPLITGPVEERTPETKTPLYHKVNKLVAYK